MRVYIWSLSVFLVLHAAYSYILLTANLDDVHSMVKQLAESPVADQLKSIWRRAYSQFKQQVGQAGDYRTRKRSDVMPLSELIMNIAKQMASSPVVKQMINAWRRTYNQFKDLADKSIDRDNEAFASDSDSDGHAERRSGGKNESYYLRSIKKILDDV